MRFDYYENLPAKEKRVYRASDAIVDVALTDVALAALTPKVSWLRRALVSGDRRKVQAATGELVRVLSEALLIPAPKVRVHDVRPRSATEELHGLYSRFPDGRCTIELWMKTAREERIVAWKTYLRTVLHEVCHHLDYAFFKLEESFHTEGFFKRESSLVRKLDGLRPTKAMRAEVEAQELASRREREVERAAKEEFELRERTERERREKVEKRDAERLAKVKAREDAERERARVKAEAEAAKVRAKEERDAERDAKVRARAEREAEREAKVAAKRETESRRAAEVERRLAAKVERERVAAERLLGRTQRAAERAREKLAAEALPLVGLVSSVGEVAASEPAPPSGRRTRRSSPQLALDFD